MSPENGTPKIEQNTLDTSYTKRLEAELSPAKNEIEQAEAVNVVLDAVLEDAAAEKIRKTVTDSETGVDIERVYSKEDLADNFAKLYYEMYDKEGEKMSLETAQLLMTRVGGLRNVMNNLLGENADPTLKHATEQWLKKNYESLMDSTDDESLVETKPRLEIVKEAPVEREPSAEEIILQEEIGEEAVKNVVDAPVPEAERVPAIAPEKFEVDDEKPSEEEVERSDEDASLEKRKIETTIEEAARFESIVMNRIEDFKEETQRLLYRIESDNYPADAVAMLLQRHGETIPSMMAMTQQMNDQVFGLEKLLASETSPLEEADQALIRAEAAKNRESVTEFVAVLRGVFNTIEAIASEARRGVSPVDELRRVHAQLDSANESLHGSSFSRVVRSTVE